MQNNAWWRNNSVPTSHHYIMFCDNNCNTIGDVLRRETDCTTSSQRGNCFVFICHIDWSTNGVHGVKLLHCSGHCTWTSQKSVCRLLSRDCRHGLKLFVTRTWCNTSPCLVPNMPGCLPLMYPCSKLKTIVWMQMTAVLAIKSAKRPLWESTIYQHSSCFVIKMTCW